jgi:hypothetical protein
LRSTTARRARHTTGPGPLAGSPAPSPLGPVGPTPRTRRAGPAATRSAGPRRQARQDHFTGVLTPPTGPPPTALKPP